MVAGNTYSRYTLLFVFLVAAVLVAAATLRVGSADSTLTLKIVPTGYTSGSELVIDIADPAQTAQVVIEAVIEAPDNAVIAIVIPGEDIEPFTVGTLTVDHTDDFLAFAGSTNLFGSNISLLLALHWDDATATDPEWVVAAGIDAISLSALNAAWTLPGGVDPNLNDGFIAVASADIAFPGTLTADAITGFFPDGFSTDDAVTVQGGVTLLGTLTVAGIIGNHASQVLFGSTTQAVTLRGQFSAPLSLFNLDGAPDAEDSPVPTQVSLSAQLPIENAVGLPGYISAVGDWELTLDIASEAGTEFEVTGRGGIAIAESVAEGIQLDLSFSVAYSGGTTTVNIATNAQPIENLFGTGITINEGGFTGTIVSGATTSAEFALSGSVNVAGATATASLDVDIQANQLQAADLSLSLSEVNFDQVVTWATTQMNLGTVDVPSVVADITLDSAVLTVKFDFTDGTSIDLEATATTSFGDIATASTSLSFSIAGGALQTAELKVEVGDVNVGQVTGLIADELGIGAGSVPGELDGITLESASLVIKLDFTDGTTLELEVAATVGVGPNITASATLTFVVAGGSLDSAELLLELGNVNLGEVTGWVGSQFGVSTSDIPGELNNFALTQASLRVGLSFSGGSSIEVAAAATIVYDGFAQPIAANLLLYVKAGAGTPELTIGLGFDSNLTFNDIIALVSADATLGDFGEIPLPNFAIGYSHTGMAWNSDEMPPEVYNFFSGIYNCEAESAPCQGAQPRNNVPEGAFLAAGIEIPEVLVEPLQALSGGFLNTDDPIVFKGSIGGLFGGGSLGIELEILLPRIQPPAPVGHVIDEASLRVALAASADMSITATLEGTLTVWLPTVLEPTLGNPDHFQRTTFLIAVDLGLSLSGVEIVLTGAVMPGPGEDDAWAAPFGQQWLTIGSLAIQVGVGVSSTGAIDLSLGMGGDVSINLGSGMKDFRASFDMAVQIRPITGPPFVTVTPKPNGFYLASDAGIDIADVIHLYNLFAGDLPVAMGLEDDFPDITIPSGWEDFNVGIKDMELSFALETNARLCLFQGLRIKADLYIAGPAGYVPETVADCVFGSSANQPREVLPGGSCNLGSNADNGCFAGLDISVSPSGLMAQASLGAITLGPVGLSNTEFELFFSPSQQHLKLAGGVVVEGVAEGNVEIFIEPTGFAFLADMNLLAALFQARIQGEGGLSLTDPTFSIQGEMQTAFGHEAVSAWRPVAQPIVAGLVVIHRFLEILSDPNLSVSQTTAALLDIPSDLQDVGLGGPAVNAAADIASEVRSLVRTIERAGFDTSFNEVFEWMLGGQSVGFPGIEGTRINVCVVRVPIKGCVARIKECVLYEKNGECWIVEPFQITIPSLCDVLNIPGSGPCNLTRVRVWLYGLVEGTFQQVTGFTVDDILGALGDAIDKFRDRPVVFNLECAAFNFDVGGGQNAPASDQFALQLWFIIMGNDVYLSLEWNFNDSFLANINRLRTSLLNGLFGTPTTPFECDLGTAIGVPSPDVVGPSNLEITNVSPSPVQEGQELSVAGTFSPGTATGSDVVNVSITWPDNEVTVLEDIGGNATSFSASKVILDDLPSGQASGTHDIIVIVSNERLGSASTTQAITVNNVAPVIDTSTIVVTRDGDVVTEVDEGDEITLAGSFSDAGILDSHHVYIDWGDGVTDSVFVPAGQPRQFSFDHAYLDGVYDDLGNPGTYDITIRVVDKDTGEASHTFPFVVHNVDPEIVAGSIEFNRVFLDDEGNVLDRQPLAFEDGQPVIEEGSAIEIYGQFTDPGLIDWHQVHIDWGDANFANIATTTGVYPGLDLEQPGLREFRSVYVYLDDDPTKGEPFGDMTVSLYVEDKDGDVSETVTETVRVVNVDPEVALDLERFVIDENETAYLTIDIVDPGILDTFTVTVDWGDNSAPSVYHVDSVVNLTAIYDAEEEEEGMPTVDEFDGVVTITLVVSHQYLDDDPTATPQDDYTIRVVVLDDDTGVGDDSIIITVVNTDPRVNFVSHPDFESASRVQYSDPLDDPVHSPNASPLVVVFDDVAADTMWVVTSFEYEDIFDAGRLPEGTLTANGTIVADGLPTGLSLVPPPGRTDGEVGVDSEHCREMTAAELADIELPGPRIACTWTVDGRVMTAPGHYIITFTATDDDTGETSVDVHLVVYPEDAEANYVGPTTVATGTLHDGYIDLELRTVIRDITDFTEGGHDLWDPWEGDIGQAIVTFYDADTGTELCTTWDVGYVFEGNEQLGVAACEARLTLAQGQQERTVNVGIKAHGWYTNERSTAEPAAILIHRPRGDFVTGAGHLDLLDGAGVYEPGPSTQLLANIRWTMPGNRALTGQTLLRFNANGRSYQINITSFETLGVDPGDTRQEGFAQIEAVAELRDRTNGGQGVIVAQELRLQLRIHDRHNTADVAFALWDDAREGRLLAASNWLDDRVPLTPLANGNIETHVR